MIRHKTHIITLLILLCIMILPTESYANSNKDKIYKNIYVGNINISELTKQEAIDKLTCEIYTKKEMKFLYNEAMYSLKVDDIELNYNIKETVDKAYNVGRNKSIIENTKTKINLKMGDKISFKLEPKYNTEMIDQYVQTISKELDKQPIDASIKIENENIQVINETNGLEVDKTKLKAIIVDKIEEINFKEESIPTNSIKPKYTHEKLSNINSVLGKYETKFNSNNYNRTNNIWIATSKTNNILLDSNEEFSFNQITGKRNTQQGFKEAPIIINGEMKKGVGGGICQVSSTIYNAALYSGLEITQARNHSIPSAYIQKGRDATVSYGSVDLKFKNIYKYPVLIQNKIVNNKVITTIYGNDQCKKQIDIVTEVIDVIPNKTIVKRTKNMYDDEKYIKEKGRKGYKVKTYRVYKNENGEISDKELINESYYPPMNKIIIKGTKSRNNGIII